jgi:UMF1 family MFS transporter
MTVKERMQAKTPEEKSAIKGWCVYDFANNAFATSVSTALAPAYFVFLFAQAYGVEGSEMFGLAMTGDAVWAWGVTIGSVFIMLISPALGVIADRATIKIWMLRIYTTFGAGACVAIFATFWFPESFQWVWLWVFFLLANMGFMGANVIYNAFLPYLGEDEVKDHISSAGFMYGYLGGGILLAVHLALFMIFSGSWVVPTLIASAGIWWFGFALYTFKKLPEPHVDDPLTNLSIRSATKLSMTELKKTVKDLGRFKTLLIYLVAFLLFTDGINTVIVMAGAFGPQVLGVSIMYNMIVILLVQFVAAPAAMFFSKLAEWTSTKAALMVSLVGWCVVTSLAIGFAPLELADDHAAYEFQAEWDETANSYSIVTAEGFELTNGKTDRAFEKKWGTLFPHGDDAPNLVSISKQNLTSWLPAFNNSRFSISVLGGESADVRVVGTEHPTHLGEDDSNHPFDWWPIWMRDNLWQPLGMDVNMQWLLLGIGAGTVLGGSQALARSLFGMMCPENRAMEFFAFQGFISKAAAVIGPLLYGITAGIWDSRVAVLSVMGVIVLGTIAMIFVNVEDGRRAARAEEARAAEVVANKVANDEESESEPDDE